MTWLDKLDAVFEKRTKGDWNFVCTKSATCHVGPTMNGPDTYDDAAFISLAGTIGDELLAVIRAAEDVHTYEDSPLRNAQLLYDDAMFALGNALAALKKKVEEGEK
jgi:hypothetical protein